MKSRTNVRFVSALFSFVLLDLWAFLRYTIGKVVIELDCARAVSGYGWRGLHYPVKMLNMRLYRKEDVT
jgi:hypothetical protein